MGAAIQAGGRRGGRGAIVGINVTPFVDVCLVLLVIMMVSSTYIVSQSLKVELPKTSTSDESTPKTYAVVITNEGDLRYEDAPITLEALEGRLRTARAARDLSLVVSADRAAKHGRVVEVIDAAKRANVTKFAINVDRSK